MRQNAKIYIMRASDGTIKLGHSVCPERRAKELGVPVDIVHQTDVIELAEKVERLAHRILALHGKHLRGEWFEASLEDAIKAIEIATKQAEGEQLPLGISLLNNNKTFEVPRPKSCKGKVRISVWVHPETRNFLKVEAIKADMSINDFLLKLTMDYIKRDNLSE